MARSTPSKDIELQSDAWQRFERAVDVVAKSPPQHKTKPATEKSKSAAKRPRPTKK
jgi:hypothetical protein